ncbi:MAG: hypothetical protein K0S65_412 [Labilithrix sp.]|nr:hypothetical protein [Labilithrix sp.]
MNEQKLSEMAAEMQRQNEAFAEVEATLKSLGDVELAVATAFLEELDELTTPPNPNPTMPFFGVRG